MPALDWLRPPRYVLTLSLLVTLAAVCAMAWLGSELLARERALDAQRARESRAGSRLMARQSISPKGECRVCWSPGTLRPARSGT